MITTYAELQSAVANWLVRGDMGDRAPEFIALAEADINRRLRHYKMEARTALTLDAEYVDLPSDWLETIRLTYNGNSWRRLDLVSPSQIDRRNALVGEPRMYTHTGTQIRLYPAPSGGTADLQYYARIPALSDVNTSNWLLSHAADVYLYGALVHSAPLLQEDERTATWSDFYERAIGALQDENATAQMAASVRRR